MGQYNGYVVTDIDGITNTITFMNGVTLKAGEAQGDVSERDLRRIQIRETILSHLEKERKLLKKNRNVLNY